jgi:hypothetical protein
MGKKQLLFSVYLIFMFMPFIMVAQNIRKPKPTTTTEFKRIMQLVKNIAPPQLYSLNTLQYYLLEGDDIRSQETWGWKISETPKTITFLNVDGSATNIPQNWVKRLELINFNDAQVQSFIELFYQYTTISDAYVNTYEGNNIVPYLMVSSWCYERGNQKQARQFINNLNELGRDSSYLVYSFGNMYYNRLVSQYCGGQKEDLDTIIALAKVFKNPMLKKYKYTKDALKLLNQLETEGKEIFDIKLPTAKAWDSLQSVFNRTEQIQFLLQGMRILHCEQEGQPIDMNIFYQQAAPYKISMEHDSFYNYTYSEKIFKQNAVINPMQELFKMKLKIKELKQIVPYLADTTFIPTFSYWRNFSSDRTLFHYYWLIDDIIFETTNQHFIDRRRFDTLSTQQRQPLIDSIQFWCKAHELESETQLIKDVLTHSKHACEIDCAIEKISARQLSIFVPHLIKIYNDSTVNGSGFYNIKNYMPHLIFDLNDGNYVEDIKVWLDKSQDKNTKIWSALHLIKYDAQYASSAADTLLSLIDKKDPYDIFFNNQYIVKELLIMNNLVALETARMLMLESRTPFPFYLMLQDPFYIQQFIRNPNMAYKDLIEALVEVNKAATSNAPDESKLSAYDRLFIAILQCSQGGTVNVLNNNTIEKNLASILQKFNNNQLIAALAQCMYAHEVVPKSNQQNDEERTPWHSLHLLKKSYHY